MTLLVIASCAAMAPKKPEDAVRERAQARWDALIKGDVERAYTFFSPGSRAVLSLTDYAAGVRKGFWKSAVVEKAACSADACEVHMAIEYEFQGKRVKTPLRETWIREGSDWWYVQK